MTVYCNVIILKHAMFAHSNPWCQTGVIELRKQVSRELEEITQEKSIPGNTQDQCSYRLYSLSLQASWNTVTQILLLMPASAASIINATHSVAVLPCLSMHILCYVMIFVWACIATKFNFCGRLYVPLMQTVVDSIQYYLTCISQWVKVNQCVEGICN